MPDREPSVTRAIVERVETHGFGHAPWAFADAEGEGFESVDDWQRGHRAYYAGEGVDVADDDEVVCVWFTVCTDRARCANVDG